MRIPLWEMSKARRSLFTAAFLVEGQSMDMAIKEAVMRLCAQLLSAVAMLSPELLNP